MNKSARPLFVQFIEQVNEVSIQLLKVHHEQQFSVDLVGEKAIDGGGPTRELFSSLIVELMNEHIDIFTFNPKRRHNFKETNQENLIPNTQKICKTLESDEKDSSEVDEEMESLLQKQLV